MPRLEEVEFYLKGLWLLLAGRPDGFKWLDFSQRGFWRSWWSIVYCLPPMLLSWLGSRNYYLASMPAGATAGAGFVARLATLDITVWVLSYLALAAVMSISGYGARITPVIIAINWLTVPIQWSMAPLSLVQIFAPLNLDLFGSALLPLLISSVLAHFLVIRRFLDGKALPTAAVLLTMIVASLWTSFTIGDLLDVSLS